MGRGQHYVDHFWHDEVLEETRIHFYLVPLLHSYTRYYHVAWTPPSLPDSVVLLGHYTGTAERNAEIVPGQKETLNKGSHHKGFAEKAPGVSADQQCA